MDDPYRELWDCCEYLLSQARSGVSLRTFELIREAHQGKALSDAYIFERLTRPVLARNARDIRSFVQDHVESNRLGELEGAAKALGESLKADLLKTIVRSLNTMLIQAFTQGLRSEKAPQALLVLASLYHAYYLNITGTRLGIPPRFSAIFYPLLIKSLKGDMDQLGDWQAVLLDRFASLWDGSGTRTEQLTAFFSHKTTRAIVSYALSGILSFLREDKEKTRYLFEVTLQIPDQELYQFTLLVSNGLNTLLKKEKRYPAPEASAQDHSPAGTVPMAHIKSIVDASVDRYFDPALDCSVQYHLALAGERPRQHLAKQVEKTFLTLNRHLWKELLLAEEIRKRDVSRTRHLLRLIIHYLFETRNMERSIWQKYIPSVERIIRYTYENDRKRLKAFNALLGKQLGTYRNKGKYQDTDWEGFYQDDQARAIAIQVLREIAGKARSSQDPSIPAVWFATQVTPGVDDQSLYRFFKQGAARESGLK